MRVEQQAIRPSGGETAGDPMSHKMRASAVVGFVMFAMFPNAALAQSPDPQFRADIERLLETTGSAKLGAQMASLVASSVMADLKESRPDIPDRAFAVVKEVLDAEFSNMFTAPDGILPDMVELYAKHFTHDDVLALLDFYGSPVGQKAITVLPLLTQEGAALGQRWGAAKVPQIMTRLQERLRAEGLFK